MNTAIEAIIPIMQTASVTYLTDFVTTYWGVMLTIGAVLFMGRWFLKLTGIGR